MPEVAFSAGAVIPWQAQEGMELMWLLEQGCYFRFFLVYCYFFTNISTHIHFSLLVEREWFK